MRIGGTSKREIRGLAMSQTKSDAVVSDALFTALPLLVEQKSSPASGMIRLALLVPALATLMVPLGLLAAFAAPAVSVAASNPIAAAQALLGLCMWTALFALPCKRIIHHFGRGRRVRIEAGVVMVNERGAIRCRDWSAPLAEFCGIAHHVRATLSGLRHELILVHPERAKSVLLHTADSFSQATLERAAALLSMPQVPPAELYRFRTQAQRALSPAPSLLLAAA